MSADNGYIIRNHPLGGYAAVMYFDSQVEEEGWPQATVEYPQFSTASAAYDYAASQYSEYGADFDDEVRTEQKQLRYSKEDLARTWDLGRNAASHEENPYR